MEMYSSTLEQRHVILRWLSHGAWLAQDFHGARASHRTVIWRLLEEAIETVESLPDQDLRWLKSGFRSGGWSNIVNTKWDVELVERLRLMAAMKPTEPGSPRSQPQRNDLDRALDVLAWVRYCTRGKDPRALQRAAVALARKGDVEEVYRLYAPHRKRTRSTITEVKNRTIDAILRGLREEHGIVPSTGLSFQEVYADAV